MSRRYLKLADAANYIGKGKTFAFKWLAEIGARIEISPKAVVYDTQIIDAYMESLRQKQNGTGQQDTQTAV